VVPLVLEPEDPLILNSMAAAFLVCGHEKEAEERILLSLDLNTSLASTWHLWGLICLSKGAPEEAEQAFSMAADLNPARRETLRNLTLLRLSRHRIPEALETLFQLIELSPEDQRTWDLYTEVLSRS
jgi:tetratricopeptide (TPR) repeat protein